MAQLAHIGVFGKAPKTNATSMQKLKAMAEHLALAGLCPLFFAGALFLAAWVGVKN
jgi:hypothetical protein